MSPIHFFYRIKPIIPRKVQISLRSTIAIRKKSKYSQFWPIDPNCKCSSKNLSGWPNGKKFALVLTHDVETRIGHNRCLQLAQLEKQLGFNSSFNFVPERYKVSSGLRDQLSDSGYEIGVHGLNHDGKLFHSKKIFNERMKRINYYLRAWNAVGFRSPSMHHNLDWIADLDIEYDMSTFDTDPFEPQADGVETIFPFYVTNSLKKKHFIELPYTLPQDFTLFILMKEKDISIWRRKLDWIAQKGGMALINTHPDYMNFNEAKPKTEEYPVGRYKDFLNYVKTQYEDQYWNVLPKDIALYWKKNDNSTRDKIVQVDYNEVANV